MRFRPVELQLKHVFSVSGFTRKSTPAVFTEIDYEGFTGYGEASMPPYLGEDHNSVLSFLSTVDLSRFDTPLRIYEIMEYVDSISKGNNAAKAAVDIAIHDLSGKLSDMPLYRKWGYEPGDAPFTSMTIGIDTHEIIRQKVLEAEDFRILKIKLGSDNDREIINTVREVTGKPLFVDVNQGWNDRNHALDMAFWLSERNVILLEQPLPARLVDDIAWLTASSPLPVIADEGIKTVEDFRNYSWAYSGINIKLMKCGGLNNARKLLKMARSEKKGVLIGCMTETSCAVSAAAHLSPAADWADLDGNHLILDTFFDGVRIEEGRITLNERPGTGAVKKQ
jgi:L-alanine-DL-glutamate epimerase-like enolase superfamily enzyme